jgi:hypothetical protein
MEPTDSFRETWTPYINKCFRTLNRNMAKVCQITSKEHKLHPPRKCSNFSHITQQPICTLFRLVTDIQMLTDIKVKY